MPYVHRLASALLAGFTGLSGIAAMAADAPVADLPGAQDHPLISRFAGSWLAGQFKADWEASPLPAAAELDPKNSDRFKTLLPLEGAVTRTIYIAPVGKSVTEVWRNYQQALAQAGFKALYACEQGCANLYFALARQLKIEQGMQWAKGYVTSPEGNRYSLNGALGAGEAHQLVASLNRGGREVHVLLHVSLANNPSTRQVATLVDIVEPRAMATGQVAVDPAALQAGLAAEGRVTLTGLFFDTGKTELKPESKPQLDAMAELLKAQPALKAWIVGHTDNVGAFDANEKLSLARAQAVVAALTAAPYKVDAKRLAPRGLASLAPVAGNGDDAGRAKNRRVELVAQ